MLWYGPGGEEQVRGCTEEEMKSLQRRFLLEEVQDVWMDIDKRSGKKTE